MKRVEWKPKSFLSISPSLNILDLECYSGSHEDMNLASLLGLGNILDER
jgi:hypothetical protein